jgi:hypothetical protein
MKNPTQGNVLTEYGLILGLIALVGVAAVKTHGLSVSELLGGFDKSKQPVSHMAELNFQLTSGKQQTQNPVAKGAVPLKGPGYYTVAINPHTGQPILQLTDNNSNAVTNATSIDGSQWNSLGQFRLANSLEDLAAAEQDPAARNYLNKLAKYSYYLGLAEGELDNVPNLQLPDNYWHIDALKDVISLKAEIQKLMNNPPSTISQESLTQALPLATDVYNIAQSYSNKLSQYANQRNIDFYPATTPGIADGEPGNMLTSTAPMTCTKIPAQEHGMTAAEVMSYQDLKAVAASVLSDNHVESTNVESTLTDATAVDNLAGGTQ